MSWNVIEVTVSSMNFVPNNEPLSLSQLPTLATYLYETRRGINWAKARALMEARLTHNIDYPVVTSAEYIGGIGGRK